MYSKFENFMKKYLAPLVDKMDKEAAVLLGLEDK